MVIQYNIVLTIVNIIDNSISKFNKTFTDNITAPTDALLYNNYHILSQGVYILDMFQDEVNAYCTAMGIEQSSIEIEEFEIVSLDNKADVFFENEEDNASLSLKPIIKCYIHPKNDALKIPELVGTAYDSTTIIWTWPNDEDYAHYLIEEAIDPVDKSSKEKIIAQLPIGTNSYTETGLNPDTPYTRRLINYTSEQTSVPSPSVTVQTETVEIEQSLEQYTISKNYDFTTDDSEKEVIEERLSAFHSGIGDDNDLKVYKQMDADFYQKFKAYFEITGRRIQKEKRYDQVGFNYKICLEAQEEIEEQEGEVTFDVDVYPREWVTIEDYMWSTLPVQVKVKFQATVFLRKEDSIPETEEVKIYKPKVTNTTETIPGSSKFIGDPLGIVFILDRTNSLHGTTIKGLCGGTDGATVMKKAVCNCIDKIESSKPSGSTVKYAVVSYGSGATIETNFTNASTAKSKVNNITVGDHTTSWGKGISKANELVPSSSLGSGAKYVAYFFSDGFPNTTNAGYVIYDDNAGSYGTHHYAHKLSTGTNTLGGAYVSIKAGLESATTTMHKKFDRVGAFICNFGNGNTYTSIIDTSSSGDTLYTAEYIKTMHQMVASKTGYAKFWNNEKTMNQVMKDFIKDYTDITPETSTTITSFDGWEEQPDDTSIVYNYSLDDYKAVQITSDIYTYEFNNTITPIHYDRKEKRVVLPLSSFLPPTILDSTSLYDIIMAKLPSTPEWAAGYTKTIGTVENPGEPDKFLIKGLFIQDTYGYGDEDEFNTFDTWEDGMVGSVNAFTDIEKMGTSTYGDDCYLVSQSNYLKIQGYTDAIIYDGTRFVNTELNAYDHPSDVLIAAGADYGDLLHNRKKSDLSYYNAGGTGSISHCIDLIQKDNDIYVTGYNLPSVGSWIVIDSMTNDLIAHNDTMYQSPILNYRFNLEDPDAKTSLYEILPDCNPDSNYLHVVLLHIYYAKNVWITDKNNYVASYGNSPIAEARHVGYLTPMTEGYYQWTKKEWADGTGQDNGWYIDKWLWFMAKPMIKIQDYYDELPGVGMETFYGLVNGRYSDANINGRKDLRVDSPKFNIPTTVLDKHKDSIKIYATITEFYPDTALVSYKWEHPFDNKDGITQVNGDYIYFSSDTITMKDIEYKDIIATINMENQEIFDNKTTEKIYQIAKPDTVYEYQNYYLKVHTDNSDVLALKYPTEIQFDETNLAEISVGFKGVVNATSQWAPRIHNGYYYLNQHEYFAYADFDVEANFEKYEESNYKTANGYVSIDVQLRHIGAPEETYSVTKNTRSELLQNESKFQWINEKGLTLKPFIDGEYYKEYKSYEYISPIILFPNKLTTANELTVNYSFEDGSTYLPMEIRAYDSENGTWYDWEPFVNGTAPTTLSAAYQVKFILQPTVSYEEVSLEDYLCCYLDWKDDADEPNVTNIVTITDHMTTGPADAQGIYVSRIFDYGCDTTLMLDLFESHYKDNIQLYIGYSNNKNSLILENTSWVNITEMQNTPFTARYFRYKIVIPAGEKLYWLHKRIVTKDTHELLPFVNGISMTGSYKASDIVTNFINTESFEIPKDGKNHIIFNRIIDIIGADVISKGFTESEIEYIKIQNVNSGIDLQYNHNIELRYPSKDLLESPLMASAEEDLDIMVNNTPYINISTSDEDLTKYENLDVIRITRGTPQQYCPIVIEDKVGNTYTQLFDCCDELHYHEEHIMTTNEKYIQLNRNDYELETIEVIVNGQKVDESEYNIVNHLLIFNDYLNIGDSIEVTYHITNSFFAEIDRENNTTTLYIYTNHIHCKDSKFNKENLPARQYKVYFETSTKTNRFVANDLSLNPIYRTDYKGFIYLTDEHNEPYEIKIYCNPLRLKAGGYDKVDVSIEVLDMIGNPIIAKDIAVDCNYGILNCEKYETDMNGVVHLVYESAYKPCTDKLTAKILKDDGTLISQSIDIINE